ncbi:hypothetical protein JB92DRAFT_3092471 [Gautieria morchelliformis]|nr:hypothetical protein JB92DRAFT_3092471 [Gautieria morchelliformis]
MTLYGTQKCEAFKYFPFAAALVSEAILGSCSLRVSASGSGDPEVYSRVLLRDGRVLWGVSAQMQCACIVALVTRFVEVLASPVASVEETHVPKLHGSLECKIP